MYKLIMKNLAIIKDAKRDSNATDEQVLTAAIMAVTDQLKALKC